MTIAAGFYCQDGVVLSADTQVTAFPVKSQESKIVKFEIAGGGNAAFAYAGNVNFALGAVQKVKRKLEKSKMDDPLAEVETILESEYRRQVLKHPDHVSNQALDYQFLIALWLPRDHARLYVTDQTSMHAVESWYSIGIGNYLARFLIDLHVPDRIYSALKLSSYALSCIKDGISDCGGMSVHVVLANDGQVGVVTSAHPGSCLDIQEYAKAYDYAARNLLMTMADDDCSDADFEQYLNEAFCSQVVRVRKKWKESLDKRRTEFAAVNPELTPHQVEQAFRRLSMGLSPIPQP